MLYVNIIFDGHHGWRYAVTINSALKKKNSVVEHFTADLIPLRPSTDVTNAATRCCCSPRTFGHVRESRLRTVHPSAVPDGISTIVKWRQGSRTLYARRCQEDLLYHPVILHHYWDDGEYNQILVFSLCAVNGFSFFYIYVTYALFPFECVCCFVLFAAVFECEEESAFLDHCTMHW